MSRNYPVLKTEGTKTLKILTKPQWRNQDSIFTDNSLLQLSVLLITFIPTVSFNPHNNPKKYICFYFTNGELETKKM